MFKLFGKRSQEDADEYIREIQEMNRIVQSDMDEENKSRIVQNMNDDITEKWGNEE